jgi:hypothetical protein
MNSLRFLLLVMLLMVVMLYQGRAVWRQVRRAWARRDYVLKVLVTVLGIYLLYGLYGMYQRGMLDWLLK